MESKSKQLFGSAFKAFLVRKRYKTLMVNKSNRDKVAKEILDTEQIYVRNLETIVQFYLKPLKTINPPLLSPKSIQIIFGHIDDLLSVNLELLTSIQDRMTTWYQDKRLGDIFLKLAPYLKVYTEYCSNYDKAVARLKQKSDESKDLQMFLKRVTSENSFGLDLISLLVTPIQRIPRYKLLLQSLISFTPSEFSDYIILNNALEKVSLVADHVNESIREKQNSEKILNIQKRFTGQCPPLLAPLRTFIREGSLTKVCRKDHKKRWFILFSDALVYGNRIDTAVGMNPIYKFHRLLPLSNTKISNLDDIKFKNSFQIIHSIKSFTLIADTEQEKTSWLNSLNDAQNSLSKNEGSVARMNKQYSKINVLKQKEEESVSTAPVWVPDNEAIQCMECTIKFTAIRRRHHCRRCGNVVCGKCSDQKWTLDQYKKDARVCKTCFNYLSISTSRSAEVNGSTSPSGSSVDIGNNTNSMNHLTALTVGSLLPDDTNVSSDSDDDSSTINDSNPDMPVINGLSSIQLDNSPIIFSQLPTPPIVVSTQQTNSPPSPPTHYSDSLPSLPVTNNNGGGGGSRPTSPKSFIVTHTAYNQENSLVSTSPKTVSELSKISSSTTSTTSATTSSSTTTTTTSTPPTLSKTGAGNSSLLDFCKAYIQSSPNVSPAKVERRKPDTNSVSGDTITNSPSQSRTASTYSTASTSSISSISSSTSSESVVSLPELKPISPPITADPVVVSISTSNSTSSSSIKVHSNTLVHSNSSSKISTTNLSTSTSSSTTTVVKQLPPTPPPKKLPPTPPPKSLPPTPPTPNANLTTSTSSPTVSPTSSPPLTPLNNSPNQVPPRPPKPPSHQDYLSNNNNNNNSNNVNCISSATQPTNNNNNIYSPNAPAPPPKRTVSSHPTNTPFIYQQQLNGGSSNNLTNSIGSGAPPLPPPRIKSVAPSYPPTTQRN